MDELFHWKTPSYKHWIATFPRQAFFAHSGLRNKEVWDTSTLCIGLNVVTGNNKLSFLSTCHFLFCLCPIFFSYLIHLAALVRLSLFTVNYVRQHVGAHWDAGQRSLRECCSRLQLRGEKEALHHNAAVPQDWEKNNRQFLIAMNRWCERFCRPLSYYLVDQMWSGLFFVLFYTQHSGSVDSKHFLWKDFKQRSQKLVIYL